MTAERHPQEERILLLAPTAKDAATTREVLRVAGFQCVPCATPVELCDQIAVGVGAVILTDHAWKLADIRLLVDLINQQPAWSDLPVVVLVRGGAGTPLGREALGAFGNVTVLERPVPMASLASVMRTLIRSRYRQYQIREHLLQRERVAAELRASEARFRLMGDSAPVLIWIAGPGRYCHWFNRPWLEFTGRELEQELGQGWAGGVHPDDLARCMTTYARSFECREPFRIDYRLRRRDGEYRWVLDHGAPLSGEDGGFTGFIGSCIDITDRRKAELERERLLASEQKARALAEASVREAEKAGRMKDEFLATLSHELRTPLNAMLGWSQIVRRDPGDTETLLEGLATIERNARTQAQIIADLLDMSRIVSGKLHLNVEQLDLETVVRAATDTARPAADAKGVALEVLSVPGGTVVSGDPDRLQQVFWNLLSNAVKFTPENGSVRVDIVPVAGQVEVRVADTGQGISEAFLPYVFDRFRQEDASTTRRNGGLGLGLAIVRQLVELHGGTVRVRSDGAGRGSTFVVRLPAASRLPLPIEPGSASVAGGEMVRAKADWTGGFRLKGLKVLVVDDEPDARSLVRRLLEECDARVLIADSAEAALSTMDRDRPDLLLSDIGMPGNDGYFLIRRVRDLESADLRHLPAIALTAYARAEERARALEAGFDAHITKPVDRATLLSTVATLGETAVRSKVSR